MSWSPPARLTVVRERWRPHPLAWIHRFEAQSIVAELREAGCDVSTKLFRAADPATHRAPEPALLRVSDPVMLKAAQALTAAAVPYVGPSPGAMARCYDKYEAWVDWAARIDLIYETSTGRLRFLECDVAPLVGARSVFAASLATSGVERAEQLRLLLGDAHHRVGTIHR